MITFLVISAIFISRFEKENEEKKESVFGKLAFCSLTVFFTSVFLFMIFVLMSK